MAFAAAGGVGVVFDRRDAAVVGQRLGVSVRTNVVRAVVAESGSQAAKKAQP
jgi:hypothetical protein